MRFRVDRFDKARFWLSVRAGGLAIAGGIGVIVASFLSLLGVLLIVTGDEPSIHRRSPYMVFTLFVGLAPLGLSVLALIRGITRWQTLKRLDKLATVSAKRPSMSSRDVAETLGISTDQAEAQVLEAAEIGLVEDEAEGPLPVAVASISGVRRTRLARSPSDPVACVGAVLNDTYRLESHLGAGGMGTVYAARHMRTGRAYAVKMILPDARASNDLVRRFEREATAAGSLGHPNIVAVHDYDETDDGVRYIVMDLLRGETLERRLGREGSLPFEDAQALTLDLAAALESAHGAGLLHRDIKPANVFLVATKGARPRAVLLDFGLVKRLDDAGASRLTSTGAAVGTPLYMSPEQARGEPLDVRSDVYSLAALLYEMTTGAPPFADPTLAGMYAKLLTASATHASALSDAPKGLDPVLDCALAKRREDRFGDVRAFAEALVRVDRRAAG